METENKTIGRNAITFTTTFIPKDAVPTPKSIVCGWQLKGYGYKETFVDDLFKFKTRNAEYECACILNCTDDESGRVYPVLLLDFDKKDNLENCTNEGKRKLLETFESLECNFGIWSTRSGGVHAALFLDDCRHFNVYSHVYKQMVDIIEERSGWKTDPKVLSERRNFIVPIHPRNMYKMEVSKTNVQCHGIVVAETPKRLSTHATSQKKTPCTAIVGDKYSSNVELLDKLVENGAIAKVEETQNDGKTILRIYMNGEDASTPLNWYCFGEGYYMYSYTDAELKMTPTQWFFKVIAQTEVVQNDVEWWDEWSRKYFYFDKLELTNEAGWAVVKGLHQAGVEFFEDKFEQRVYAVESANPNVIRQNKKPQELTGNLLKKFETDYPNAFVIEADGKKPAQVQKSQYLPNVELYAHEHGKNRMIDSLKADLKRVEDECPELLDKTPNEVCQELVDNVFGDLVENKHLLVEVMSRFAFASVARAITDNPDGFKFDNCLVLEGQQGIRKSWFCQHLTKPEFHESMAGEAIANHKDMVLSFDGKRVIELEECSKITRQRDANHIKAHLSAATDTIRKPYAAETYRHVRRYVHIATTNDSQFLKDSTGNRRFWCFKLKHSPKRNEHLETEWLIENRWKLWGYFFNVIKNLAEEDWSKHSIIPHTIAMELEGIASGKVYESDSKIQIRMWFEKLGERGDASEWIVFQNRTALDDVFGGDGLKLTTQEYNRYSDDFKEVAVEFGYEYIRCRKKGRWDGKYVWASEGVIPD